MEETCFSFAREKATAKYCLCEAQDACPADLSGVCDDRPDPTGVCDTPLTATNSRGGQEPEEGPRGQASVCHLLPIGEGSRNPEGNTGHGERTQL